MSDSSVEAPVQKQHIKRPPNAWVIYRAVKSKEYQQMHPDRKFFLGEMSGIMSGKWAAEPEEEIRRFERLAEEAAAELLALHPDYEYRPRKRGSKDKPKKPRKVKEGRVTKSRATKKGKTVLPSAINQPTNVDGGECPEANGPALAPSVVVELGSMMAPNDQYVASNFNQVSNDNTVFSPDDFNVGMLANGAQSVAYLPYYGQPYACPNDTTMQSFGAFQVNADQPTAELGGQPEIYYDPSYAGGSLQLFDAYGAHTMYEQTAQLDVVAGPSGANAAAYFQNEGGFRYFDDVNNSTHDSTYSYAIGNQYVSFDASVDTAGAQDADAIHLKQHFDLLATEQHRSDAWAAAGWVLA